MNNKNPMFLKFINREIGVIDLLNSFALSKDPATSKAAKLALNDPPDLEEFRKELEEATGDLATEGLGEEFKAFANHYMEQSLIEDVEVKDTPQGENRSCIARIKDSKAPWIEGFVCYNLSLYIKVFGLDNLKKCRICGKLFANKGKYAVYCSEKCKSEKNRIKQNELNGTA